MSLSHRSKAVILEALEAEKKRYSNMAVNCLGFDALKRAAEQQLEYIDQAVTEVQKLGDV